MPVLTLTLSAAHLVKVVAAFSANYAVLLPDGSVNPQTRGEFALIEIKALIRGVVAEHEQNMARNAIVTVPVDIT